MKHSFGKYWGRFSLAASQISVLVSTVTMLTVLIPAYMPTSSWFAGFGIHFPFWMFVLVAVAPLLVAYFISWKYLVGSFYGSSTEQFWKGENSVEVKKQLARIEAKLDEVLSKK